MRIINFDKIKSRPTKAQVEFIKKYADFVDIKKLTFEKPSAIINNIIEDWSDYEPRGDYHIDECVIGDELYGR